MEEERERERERDRERERERERERARNIRSEAGREIDGERALAAQAPSCSSSSSIVHRILIIELLDHILFVFCLSSYIQKQIHIWPTDHVVRQSSDQVREASECTQKDAKCGER